MTMIVGYAPDERGKAGLHLAAMLARSADVDLVVALRRAGPVGPRDGAHRRRVPRGAGPDRGPGARAGEGEPPAGSAGHVRAAHRALGACRSPRAREGARGQPDRAGVVLARCLRARGARQRHRPPRAQLAGVRRPGHAGIPHRPGGPGHPRDGGVRRDEQRPAARRRGGLGRCARWAPRCASLRWRCGRGRRTPRGSAPIPRTSCSQEWKDEVTQAAGAALAQVEGLATAPRDVEMVIGRGQTLG